jgi:hypothetical protein
MPATAQAVWSAMQRTAQATPKQAA